MRELAQPTYVPYMDLSGGLDTKRDPHAIRRNETAVSVNTWLGTGNAISKRPGTVAIGNGTGSLNPITSLVAGFFNEQTTLVAQSVPQGAAGPRVYYNTATGPAWQPISGSGIALATPYALRCAQMYDPDGTQQTTLFLVDGVNGIRTWAGPGSIIGSVLTGPTYCPLNHAGSAPITPRFVNTAGFYLFYAGEPTEPCGVYISNPYHPQEFNISSTTSPGITTNPYIPYLVGFNDGVNGGDITGIEPLFATMMVYKQQAIYVMQQIGLFGETYWDVSCVSASVGATSPRSIVRFDTFHVFLGIDGVYTVDPVDGTRRISDNVPTLFDGSLTGVPAAILDRTTAVGVRQGQRYIIFFDDGNGTGVPAGYTTLGAVFDFAKQDADGLPAVTLIRGMNVGGAVPLRGPADDGNFAWGDATQDRIGKFGIGFSDFGNPITTTFAGKSDFFTEEFGPEAPLVQKATDDVWFLVSAPLAPISESLTFTCNLTTNLLTTSATESSPILPPAGGGLWGTKLWGVLVWSGSANSLEFVALKIPAQETAQGNVLQFSFTESSTLPWTCLGYIAYVSAQRVSI
jgi:hypothetical protein